ncbi:MAG: YegS/Rv2252/BmrU family lipid kinase [Lachnospiraceae bacterium]|nr:YegS/Rv2252/BmrU family lipid kinase [Lachnospiraceae bacterium]
MSRKLLFVYNPLSGKGMIKQYLSDIVDILIKADFEVTIYATQSVGDAIRKCREDAERYDRIVCSGGDGTLDEVVTGLMQSGRKIPVGYIPAGSTNDFGSSLGIDKEMLGAAHIAAGEHSFLCDLGSFSDNYFVYVAAFGIFTEVSYATDQKMKNMLGHAAYILEGAKQLRDIPSYRMLVEYDGNIFYDEFIFGMVTNSLSVGGFKGIISGEIGLNDGVFEVTLIRTPRNPVEFNEILGFLTGIIKDTELVYSFQTRQIKLTSSDKVPWTLDGEFGGKMDSVIIKNLRESVEIMVE